MSDAITAEQVAEMLGVSSVPVAGCRNRNDKTPSAEAPGVECLMSAD